MCVFPSSIRDPWLVFRSSRSSAILIANFSRPFVVLRAAPREDKWSEYKNYLTVKIPHPFSEDLRDRRALMWTERLVNAAKSGPLQVRSVSVLFRWRCAFTYDFIVLFKG
ncbi:hypothetical protein EVAR_58461_1 [Eumeta japonica]|uniref:Uncharacterized protein n=1 Tax=Eumeta variegata TaxID=151549 RepID=A0A4C1Z7A0_EUMVA|nr:hypothetical protein EVAR_58461_1 [Eumeta japonica]